MKVRRPVRFVVNNVLWLTRATIFVVLIIIALSVYQLLIDDIRKGHSSLFLFIVLWIFTAYIVLPRIHRVLSRVYLPNYYLGRVRTSDGLLGDPVNLAVIGSRQQLIAVMEGAGWHQAEALSLKSRYKITVASVLKKSYLGAPVSSLFLFNSKQDLAFQQEVGGNPRKRHHVRFWQVPEGWWLPGGFKVDWLGAATFDRRVGLSAFTLQITHKIAAQTDKERNYVVSSVKDNNSQVRVEVIKHFTTAYHSRNGGGDAIATDGAMPFIDLSRL
jgi:hypothetical protein